MKSKIINIFILLLSFVLCGGCVFACCLYNTQYAFIPVYIACSAFFLFFASLFHEFGHMLFGAFVKIKVKLVYLKPFSSSSVKIIPKTVKNLKRRVICTVSGGLVINALFIVLGALALFVPVIPVYISLVLPASFYIFALNALPLQFESGKTDGLVLHELATGSDEAKVMLAVLAIQAQILSGKPIEEIDKKFFIGLPVIREDDQSFIALTELRHEYFKAKGDEEQAEKYKNRLEELKEYLH